MKQRGKHVTERGLHSAMTKRDESQLKTDTSWQKERAMFQQTHSYSWLSKKSAVWWKVWYSLLCVCVCVCVCVCYFWVLPLVKSVTAPGLKIASVRMQSYLYSSHTPCLQASMHPCSSTCVCVCVHASLYLRVWQPTELILILALLRSITLSWVIHFVSPLIVFVSLCNKQPHAEKKYTHSCSHTKWGRLSWMNEWQLLRKE